MFDEFDDIGETEIGLDADEQALVNELMADEGISGDDDEGSEDIDLDDVSGDVEIGRRGGRRRVFSSSVFRRALGKVKKRSARAGFRAGVQKARSSGRPGVRSSAPSSAETAILAFQKDASKGGLIAAGASDDISAEPQNAFKPEALIIGDEVAADFLVTEVKIGTKSLWVNTGGVPASMFRADGVLGKLLLNKTGQISQQITISVTNISTSSRPFHAAMVGWSAN